MKTQNTNTAYDIALAQVQKLSLAAKYQVALYQVRSSVKEAKAEVARLKIQAN
jgi:hypothetical protein